MGMLCMKDGSVFVGVGGVFQHVLSGERASSFEPRASSLEP